MNLAAINAASSVGRAVFQPQPIEFQGPEREIQPVSAVSLRGMPPVTERNAILAHAAASGRGAAGFARHGSGLGFAIGA